jgi:hypothetical protein
MKRTLIERARAYITTLPVSIQGQGGSTAAFNVAVALMRGFALSQSQALPLFNEWNAGCLPPWTEAELLHKLQSAHLGSTRPTGYLLRDGEALQPSTTPDFESEAERKARKRQTWPAMKPLTEAERNAVATLRRLPLEAVNIAAHHGYLCGADVEGHRCFILRDGTFAQARRLDGGTLRTRQGETKAKNLEGSQGAFLGHGDWLGGSKVKVLLVEGAVGLLEGIAAWYLADPDAGWTVIAATSASSRFNRDPQLLTALAGRHIVIVADNDEAGTTGALSWLTDLEAKACTVRVTQAPDGHKDLGTLVAQPEAHLPTLKTLFQ